MFNVIPATPDDSGSASEAFNSIVSAYAKDISDLNIGLGLTSALEQTGYEPDNNGVYTMSISELLVVCSRANQESLSTDFSRMSEVYSFLETLSTEFNNQDINPDKVTIIFANGENVKYITYGVDPYEAICAYVLEKDDWENQTEFLLDYLGERNFRNKVLITQTDKLMEYSERFPSLLRTSAYALQKRFSPIKQSFVNFLGLDESTVFSYPISKNGQRIIDPIFVKLYELVESIDDGTNLNLRDTIISSDRGTRSISEIRNLIKHIEEAYSEGDRDVVIKKVLLHYHQNIEFRKVDETILEVDKSGITSRLNPTGNSGILEF